MSERSDAFAARLLNCYAAAVHDVLRSMGQGRCVLPPNIKPLDPTKKLAGEVYTVSGHVDMTRDPHDTLVQWTGLLSQAPAGKVLVCQPHTYEIALMGELSAETLNFRGIRGYVVDGGCRDTDFILELGFPVFCTFTTPTVAVSATINAATFPGKRQCGGPPLPVGRAGDESDFASEISHHAGLAAAAALSRIPLRYGWRYSSRSTSSGGTFEPRASPVRRYRTSAGVGTRSSGRASGPAR
jgi:regulator of RNase E activity RraA